MLSIWDVEVAVPLQVNRVDVKVTAVAAQAVATG